MRQTRTIMLAAMAGSVLGFAGATSAAPWRIWANHLGGPRGTNRQHTGPGNPTDSFPISDNFDSYPLGSFPCAVPTPSCAGVNGWSLWGVAETSTGAVPGPNDGQIVASPSHSGKALRIGASAVDIVQTGSLTTGAYDISLYTFVPGGVTTPASASAYVIVMNTYNPPVFANSNWSIQVQFNQITGALIDANHATSYGSVVFDQWIPLRIHIDLASDMYTVYYNNVQAWGPTPYSTGFTTGGAVAIACVDLFSDDSSGVVYDDFSVAASGSACYANCDGSTGTVFLTINDFVCFQSAFAAGGSYANCDGSTNTPVLTINDFVCFQSAFAAGCSAP